MTALHPLSVPSQPPRESAFSFLRRLIRNPDFYFTLLLVGVMGLTIPAYRLVHPDLVAMADARRNIARKQAHLVAGRIDRVAAALERDPRRMNELAHELAWAGQGTAASHLFRKAAELGEVDLLAVKQHASLVWARQEPGKALALIQSAEQAGLVLDRDALEMKASLYLSDGRPQAALDLLENLPAGRKPVSLLGLHAGALAALGRHEESLNLYREILAREPLKRQTRLDYARALAAAAVLEAKASIVTSP